MTATKTITNEFSETFTVAIGDTVCFKWDFETCGKIVAFGENFLGELLLTCETEDGTVQVEATRCSID